MENRPPNRGPVDQQYSYGRNFQSFRINKPLLHRKRPGETSGFFSIRIPRRIRASTGTESPAQNANFNRLPLVGLPINTPSTRSKPGSSDDISDGVSCGSGTFSIRPGHDKEVANAFLSEISSSNRFSPESFVTPNNDCLNRSLLDEDFDESMFEEIDAICEKSARKAEGQEPSASFDDENQCTENKNNEFVVGLDVSTAKMYESGSNNRLEREGGNMAAADPALIECMPDEYSKYMHSLNDRQRDAACSDISTPLMVIAGPGSGKTSTMVGRVLVLMNEGIHPSNILAMTFTTAATLEMRERIAKFAGKKAAKELTISTFHSFSLQLCRSHAEKLERTSEFSIFGHGQQRRAIIEAVRLYENEKDKNDSGAHEFGDGLNGTRCPEYFKDKSKKWQKYVAQAKASGKTPVGCCKAGNEMGAAILSNYNNILKSCNALDYHDLISCSVRLLDDFPEVFMECQETWKAIIVDEFQDTSAMQYKFLRILGSHNHITIVGDDDQSIFSFNGADISGFDSFRTNFPTHKEVRLIKNYRSTRCIVEAASSIIKNNMRRFQSKSILSENTCGSKITVKECHSEDAQCAFVIDKILESTNDGSACSCSYGDIAILYRRQVSGKVFQTALRERKLPFNVHGVAFYRKKVVRAIVAMLKTALSECDDSSYRRVFKALLPFDKEEKTSVIEHVDKVLTSRKCSFISAASDIFSSKISGTFKRSQLTQGRKVLHTLEMIAKLVQREQSLSSVVTSVANMVPQKYLLEQRAVLNVDGGKLLNEDNDLRTVLQHLMDDVSDFLSAHFTATEGELDRFKEQQGCTLLLKSFIDYITERESENLHSRRRDNKNSVTLSTIHQSKGLEWDIVFIIKANETEIPLLHEANGVANESGTSLEEERRLLYVAMTRARKKLFILYVTVDASWQVLQPSRFLKEIPNHLIEIQGGLFMNDPGTIPHKMSTEADGQSVSGLATESKHEDGTLPKDAFSVPLNDASEESTETTYAFSGDGFLKRFSVEDRSIISHLFHSWAKKQAFKEPRRLLDKIRFVIDERLAIKKNKHKDVLRALKSSLTSIEAFQYAEHILRWEQLPADKRAHIMREKQEHFQKLRIENSMSSSAPTSKQIAYLQNLGCTVTPTSRLHASRLIEQYKSL